MVITTASCLQLACGPEAGAPAAPAATPATTADATVREASAPAPADVSLRGVVVAADGGAPIPGAIVLGELGGFHRPASLDGATPSLAIDLFVRNGALTTSAGAFAFEVQPGVVGLRVLSPAYEELLAPATAASDASAPLAVLAMHPLSPTSALPRHRPIAADLGANLAPEQRAVAPLSPITFAVNVLASAADPLSSDVFLLQPDTQWAGVLAPPTSAVPGEPYPNGVYNRVVEAPSEPGVYTYTVVAVSMARVSSYPVSIHVTVTESGANPFPDAGYLDDAALDASYLRVDGAVPDGRY